MSSIYLEEMTVPGFFSALKRRGFPEEGKMKVNVFGHKDLTQLNKLSGMNFRFASRLGAKAETFSLALGGDFPQFIWGNCPISSLKVAVATATKGIEILGFST